MKLLFDQNISYRLVKKIIDTFPGAAQIKELGLVDATDREIWEYAKDNSYSIVTFDADFSDLSTLLGFPPKIVWLRSGNTVTSNLEKLLKKHS